MQARSEFSAAAQNDTASRGSSGAGSFKSKRPLAVIATPDLDLWAQLGPMLESTCALRHAELHIVLRIWKSTEQPALHTFAVGVSVQHLV